MSYQWFNEKKLRQEIIRYADSHSYRAIEVETNGKIKKSKAQRLATRNANLRISDAQILMNLFETCWDDYIVIHMI